MARQEVSSTYRVALSFLILSAIGAAAFAAGMFWSTHARAADDLPSRTPQGAQSSRNSRNSKKRNPRVVYPSRTELDFEGTQIEGELRNPGEFYFQHRNEEKFDSLVKRRKNFHREMLRDVILSK
jgi:hypothetical protein